MSYHPPQPFVAKLPVAARRNAPKYAHWPAGFLAAEQGAVAGGKHLVGYLAARSSVAIAVARVPEIVFVTFIVLVLVG
jgi:hypothetical protein